MARLIKFERDNDEKHEQVIYINPDYVAAVKPMEAQPDQSWLCFDDEDENIDVMGCPSEVAQRLSASDN